ncbi:hypothetical protein IE81DRAFT_325959 [Ceraceosorus guamensis]|uniref:Translation initiation factor eIF2B subunit epsilon n=1 Tax=Ceraceosorus guamensis TaxID=1522189 RepID=A0A316VSK3_9BASI|nr:hypothetical protein IE81DRAFT_325959 [Ceraceosorus guamensis]PWN40028.1 hypothetical protein IE81DRAFT_325959 [Ceraceosorus guamensis]
MPPKKTKTKSQGQAQSGGGGGGGDREGAQEEPLSAILIADTFSRAYSPLEVSRSHHRPACPLLLPVLGVPLLKLHLASIHKAGAEQVHIISRAHANTLRRWLQQHPPPTGLQVHVVAAPAAGSVGDVMREVDAHGIVRSDFLLLQPHALTSIHLQSVVEMHRQRRKRDKDASMTICAAQVGHASRIRPPHAAVHTLSSCDRLLHYDPPAFSLSSSPTTRIPTEVLMAQEDRDHGEFIIRSDLVEIGIDVCGPEIPALFSENFDYQSLRHDFVPGILTSDLLDTKIFLHISPSTSVHPSGSSTTSASGYGAQIDCTRQYHAVICDLISGAAQPLRPGNASWPGEPYALRGTAFIGTDVSVARDARLGRNVVIGAQSSIAQGVVLDCTAVGSHVDIASSSTISHSHLWDGVRIGSRCEMDHCIIGTGAQILDDCKLARGCIIGPDVTVGPGISLAPFTRVGARSRANALEVEDLEEDVEDRAPDADLGSQAFGYRWPAAGESTTDEIAEGEEADEDDDDVDAPLRDHIGVLGIDLLQKGKRHEGEEEEEEDSDISSIGGDSELLDEWEGDSETLSSSSLDDAAAASLTLGGEGEEATTAADRQAARERLEEFDSEARASLARAFAEGHSVENASVELKTLRMASNVPLSQVRRTAIAVVLERCDPNNPKWTAAVFDKWGKLIQSIAEDDEVEAIGFFQEYCATQSSYSCLFIPLLKKMYNDDVVSPDAIVEWWKSPISRAGGEAALDLRKKAEGIVRYIVEDDEEESEEESE